MTLTPDQAPAHTAKDGKGILITEPAMQQLAKLCGEQAINRFYGWECAPAVAAA